MVHDMRIPPIVCSRESVSASLHIIFKISFIFHFFFFFVFGKLFSAFFFAESFFSVIFLKKKFKVGSDWEFKMKST